MTIFLAELKRVTRDLTEAGVRIQDRADLLALLKVATLRDSDLARSVVGRISGSLYAQGRDLIAEFDQLLGVRLV